MCQRKQTLQCERDNETVIRKKYCIVEHSSYPIFKPQSYQVDIHDAIRTVWAWRHPAIMRNIMARNTGIASLVIAWFKSTIPLIGTYRSRIVFHKPDRSATLISFPIIGGLNHRYDWQQAA